MHDAADNSASPLSRPVQESIPSTRQERENLRSVIARYIADGQIVPPVTFSELEGHTQAVLAVAGLGKQFTPYAAVMTSNEVWREAVAAVPFARRLLLLPQCLRHAGLCQGKIDEYGLLCGQCGRCVLMGLKEQAERLGYVVLVAEGTAVVMSLIASGKIEAVVGVSCLSALQRVYPYMEAAAIPALAIPLLQEGCADTSVDVDWVQEAIQLNLPDRPAGQPDTAGMLDMDSLRQKVEGWFTPGALASLLGPAQNQTEKLAREWLSQAGKRWRPLLATCAYQAFREDFLTEPDEDFHRVAVAVECFHKASLIHDDIEDGDRFRYAQATLHEQHGVPMALNVGDFLLGEGYRLIGQCQAPPADKVRMLQAAAAGHRSLCIGQGEELWWLRNPRPLSSEEVTGIFRRKTAPAFEVALCLGALYAGTKEEVWRAFGQYSEALGIAYQIQDDLDDLHGLAQADAFKTLRPSILLALAHESAQGADRQRIEQAWQQPVDQDGSGLLELLKKLDVQTRAEGLLDFYQRQATSALQEIAAPLPKRLLRRVLARIFVATRRNESNEEFSPGDAPGRKLSTESAA